MPERTDDACAAAYVRFQSPVADDRGRHIGVFGLVNMLGRRGRLSEADERFRVEANAWYDAAYTNPAEVDPRVYDESVHPLTATWFKTTADHLVDRVDAYLELLERYDVPCVRLEAGTVPGRLVYEDEYQVVVVPD